MSTCIVCGAPTRNGQAIPAAPSPALTREALLDELSDEWVSVERTIWPEGPAHGHGSGAFAILKAKIIAALDTPPPAGPLPFHYPDREGKAADTIHPFLMEAFGNCPESEENNPLCWAIAAALLSKIPPPTEEERA